MTDPRAALADRLDALHATLSMRVGFGAFDELIEAAAALRNDLSAAPIPAGDVDLSEPPFAYRFEYADESAFEIMEDGRYFLTWPDGRREEKHGKKITSNIRQLVGRARMLAHLSLASAPVVDRADDISNLLCQTFQCHCDCANGEGVCHVLARAILNMVGQPPRETVAELGHPVKAFADTFSGEEVVMDAIERGEFTDLPPLGDSKRPSEPDQRRTARDALDHLLMLFGTLADEGVIKKADTKYIDAIQFAEGAVRDQIATLPVPAREVPRGGDAGNESDGVSNAEREMGNLRNTSSHNLRQSDEPVSVRKTENKEEKQTATPPPAPVAQREALKKYGGHINVCDKVVDTTRPCTCGFDDALRAALASEAQPGAVAPQDNDRPFDRIDLDALYNLRSWVEQAVKTKGGKVVGAGVGIDGNMGVADVQVQLEGHEFNLRIKPLPAPQFPVQNAEGGES